MDKLSASISASRDPGDISTRGCASFLLVLLLVAMHAYRGPFGSPFGWGWLGARV